MEEEAEHEPGKPARRMPKRVLEEAIEKFADNGWAETPDGLRALAEAAAVHAQLYG